MSLLVTLLLLLCIPLYIGFDYTEDYGFTGAIVYGLRTILLFLVFNFESILIVEGLIWLFGWASLGILFGRQQKRGETKVELEENYEQNQIEVKLNNCPDCGKDVSPRAVICVGCGAPLDE